MNAPVKDMFLDISDVVPDERGLDELPAITENLPGAITRIAGLAAFGGWKTFTLRFPPITGWWKKRQSVGSR
ncbi:hypothetical protein C8J57DRAFT_1533148 [Mycena rebaudengoi]|nr:hypothetical protein C8J57DRAFT_1533148 [Mycena rebaudengoi]